MNSFLPTAPVTRVRPSGCLAASPRSTGRAVRHDTASASRWASGVAGAFAVVVGLNALPVGAGAAAQADAGSISGRVIDDSGAPVVGIDVSAEPIEPGGASGTASTGTDGTYMIAGLSVGDHRVRFSPPSESVLIFEYYNDTTDYFAATPVPVTSGEPTRGIDARLEHFGSITGRVTDGQGHPVAEVEVGVEPMSEGDTWATGVTDADGRYAVDGMIPGDYVVRFGAPADSGLVDEYFNDAIDYLAATLVPVVSGQAVEEIDAVLTEDGPQSVSPPAAPAGVSAAPGDTSAKLSWTAPHDGGSPITGYVVTASPGGKTCATSTLTCTVTGLTNGTAYTFVVSAANAAGTGPASAASNSTTPRTVPSAPRSLTTAVAPTSGVGSGQVRLAWTAPSSNGGAAITDYVIERSPNGTSGWTTINDGVRTTTTYTVTGLSNGTRYYFRVTAKNGAGNGPASTVVNTIPRTKPGAPGGVRATSLRRSVRLTWNAPATGGSAITDYVIQRSMNGRTWSTVTDRVTTSRTHTVTGLRSGLTYRFRVAARNAAGTGSYGAVVAGRGSERPSSLLGTGSRGRFRPVRRPLHRRAPSTGLEPVAYRLGGGRSIHLSYEGSMLVGSWTL